MKHVWTLEKSSTYVTFEPNLLLFFFQFWSCDDSTTVMLDVFWVSFAYEQNTSSVTQDVGFRPRF